MDIMLFKKDLRVQDNIALFNAIANANSNLLCLYIIEPNLYKQDDISYRHYQFLLECLESLNKQLKDINLGLCIKVGEYNDVFTDLINKYDIKNIYSYQETGNMWTYKRDIAFQDLLDKHNINWYQYQQNGVVRKLKTRDAWASLWYKTMSEPIINIKATHSNLFEISDNIPTAEDLGLKNDKCYLRQLGGTDNAFKELHRFLYTDGQFYSKEMSSPITAEKSCSRISPYLTFGCISIKQVFQLAEQRSKEVKLLPAEDKKGWGTSIRSFLGRLRWHCHFIQKLEDEPLIELKNLHTSANLLDRTLDDRLFNAWSTGNTGYPFIDACMRSLIATGWINFRMRAMLMSFASYHLWLDWRKTSVYLARLFTDYEPGIHYSQTQMQSGTTGINAIRIYNPLKQSQDQDPQGVFIRKWIPELKNIPDMFIHTPWLYKQDLAPYCLPIVDEKIARKQAADKIYALRKQDSFKEQSSKIMKKHGSRKKPNNFKSKAKDNKQLELDI